MGASLCRSVPQTTPSACGVLERPPWRQTSQDQRWLRPPSRQCALQELPALPPHLTTSQDTAATMDASLPKSCRSRVPLLPQPLCQSGSHFVRGLLLLPSTPTKRLQQVQVAAPALPRQHRLRAPPLSRPRRPRLLSQRSPASRFWAQSESIEYGKRSKAQALRRAEMH